MYMYSKCIDLIYTKLNFIFLTRICKRDLIENERFSFLKQLIISYFTFYLKWSYCSNYFFSHRKCLIFIKPKMFKKFVLKKKRFMRK
jgi:hypothetical protein